MLAAAGGLVVIACFFPLLAYATDGFVWRFGIWVAFDFARSGEPGTQIQWVSGIAFTCAALLALWAALDVVRSRGQADGWPRRQQLFSVAAGLLVGTCGFQAALLLPRVFADQRDLGGDLLVTPGAGLYLIAASALLAIAALVLNWLAAPRRLQLVTHSASSGTANGPVPSSPEANPAGTPAG